MKFDDYLPCDAYANQPRHATEKRFSAFFDEKSKRYFFALLDEKGAVMLKSEGYPQEKSRETGIQSVVKNLPIRERFTIISENNEFFVSLRAGNRQEIARSCGFTTMAAAEKFVANFFEPVVAPKAVKAEKAVKEAVPAAAKTTAKVEKTVKVAAPAAEKVEVKTVKTEAPAAKKAETAAAPKKTAEVKMQPKQAGVKHYADLSVYFGHPTISDIFGPTGYALFEGPDAKFYFSVYNPDGSVYLRSCGFDSLELRDAELEAVKSNIVDPEKYRVIEEGEQFAVALVDELERELARSGAFNSFTQAFVTTPKGRVRTEGIALY